MTTINPTPHVGDTVRIEIWIRDLDNMPLPINTATVKQFHIKPPTGATMVKTATFITTGADGGLYYECLNTDLSVDGEWKVQAYIEIPVAKQYHADIFGFTVLANV